MGGSEPADDKIYVTNNVSNNVTVIDGASNTVTATVSVGSSPISVAVNPMTNTNLRGQQPQRQRDDDRRATNSTTISAREPANFRWP